jgi:hypothetical protein
MKSMLCAVLTVMLLASTQFALAGNWSMQCPPGWSDERSGLGNDLVKQCIAPNRDAFVELYSSQGEVLPLDHLLQQWEAGMLAKGMPFQNRVRMQDGQVSGVPARTWEYTGMANGARFHSYVSGTVHGGNTYVIQGLYVEERAALQDQVRAALNSFVFTDRGANVMPRAMGQGGGMQGGMSGGMGQGGAQGSAGSASGGAGTPVAGLKDRAWKTGGNMAAQWGLAHGSIAPGKDFCTWELTTTRSLGLHFRDPYKQGKQSYVVDIVDKPSGRTIQSEVVGMMSKMRVGPGHFVITVRPASGYAGWKCEWE